MLWGLANLDESKIKSIKSLEEELGVNILAFSDYGVGLAELSKEELEKIRDLEDELEVSLIATEKEK